MNDDEPVADLEVLKQEHRELDALIDEMSASGLSDQLELARMKRRKLRLKDAIQRLLDAKVPDIIA